MISVHRGKVAVGVLCALLVVFASAVCSANVFSSSVSLGPVDGFPFPPPPNGQSGYLIETWTQPNNTGDGAFLGLTINSSLVLSAYAATVGIGEEWYSVTNGTVLSPATQSSLTPFANNLTAPFYPGQIQLSLGQDFYLGFWLQEPPNNEYGWAHLEYTANGLGLLGNEIEDTGSGIIVGTTTVVPEPSALYLAVLAILPLLACSKRVRNHHR